MLGDHSVVGQPVRKFIVIKPGFISREIYRV